MKGTLVTQLNNTSKFLSSSPDPVLPLQEVANDGGFQWGNIFNVVMKVLFGGPVNGPDGASDKMDYITQLTVRTGALLSDTIRIY